MSTSGLSPTERHSLQAGEVMKVFVTGNDGDVLSVEFQNKHAGKDGKADVEPKSVKHFTSSMKTSKFAISKDDSKDSKPVRRPMFNPMSLEDIVSTSTVATTVVKPPPAPPAGAILLNSLKTGMRLRGSVVNSTPYASFIGANVYRPGRGGVFVEVNGMLHKSDVADFVLKNYGKLDKPFNAPFLDKGTSIPVYVKEVFKNCG